MISTYKKSSNIYIRNGLILLFVIVLLELFLLYGCTDDLLCAGLLIIPTLPGVIIVNSLFQSNAGWLLMVINAIFYFLLGYVITWLVMHLKKGKHSSMPIRRFVPRAVPKPIRPSPKPVRPTIKPKH